LGNSWKQTPPIIQKVIVKKCHFLDVVRKLRLSIIHKKYNWVCTTKYMAAIQKGTSNYARGRAGRAGSLLKQRNIDFHTKEKARNMHG
jgi:hypothetical protein